MGVRLGEDLGRRAGRDELGQHLAAEVAGVLDLAPELAVRKGARAALAELDVAFGLELPAPPQAPGVLGALAHDPAAIEDDRAEPHLRQDQPREEPARPRADHHRTAALVRAGARDRAIAGVRRRLEMRVAREARQHRRLVAQRDVHRVDHRDRRFFARVIGTARDSVRDQLLGADAKPRADRGSQRVGGVAER